MTSNTCIVCKICEEKINLRYQVGHFNIPFNIYCPGCDSLIQGKVNIDQEKMRVGLDLSNAEELKESRDTWEDKIYVAELSAEFITRKMYQRGRGEYDLTPFMRSMNLFGDKEFYEYISKAVGFANYLNNDWPELKSYFQLFWNDRNELLYPKLEKELGKYDVIPLSKVENKLDAVMALHQLLIGTTNIDVFINPMSLGEYIDTGKHIERDLDLNETMQLIQLYAGKINSIERKAFELIDFFGEIYEQLIPVVSLRNAGHMDSVDRGEYGILTANFDRISNFYAKSYEWILDNIDIVIGLNNIAVRGSYGKCAGEREFSELATIKNKFSKLKYLDDTEPYSKAVMELNNRIRNAIQHFDNRIDHLSQKIIFEDNYGGKSKKVELYLIDFVELCLDNFSVILYLLELIYQLRKIFFIKEGFVPSYTKHESKAFSRDFEKKKIGRNERCPCGSGKKYKHCCGGCNSDAIYGKA